MSELAKVDDTQELQPVSETMPANQADRFIELAIRQDAPIEKLERLMAMKERMDAIEADKAMVAALSRFRAEVPPIEKDAVTDFTNKAGQRTHYRYPSLGNILKVIGPIESKYGLDHDWRFEQDGDTIRVTCSVRHTFGGKREITLFGPYDTSGNKNSLQSVGSAAKYLQRYTLLGALGLESLLANEEDDDGEEGGIRVAPFTPLQRARVIHLIEEGKAQDLYEYVEEIGQPVYTAIFGSFDDGKKHAQKQKARELEGEGARQLQAILDVLREAITNEDDLAFKEVYEEQSFIGKAMIWNLFGKEQRAKAKELLK